MNLAGMGAAGMDNMSQQIQASSSGVNQEHNPGMASNAALITSMANI